MCILNKPRNKREDLKQLLLFILKNFNQNHSNSLKAIVFIIIDKEVQIRESDR